MVSDYNLYMEAPRSADHIAAKLTEAFGLTQERPTPQAIEQWLRPLAPVTYETEEQVKLLLFRRGQSSLATWVGSWFEANDVVLNSGDHVERRIQFLLHATCICVLDHLPQAIAHATGPVDPRIRMLLEHPYLR